MQVAEVKYLRQQVAELRVRLGLNERVAPSGERIVLKPEIRIDVKAVGEQREALLNLVVAVENYFGPEKGTVKPSPSPELTTAHARAAKLVKREKKP